MADGSGSGGDIDPEGLALLEARQELARLMIAASEQELKAFHQIRAILDSGVPLSKDEVNGLIRIVRDMTTTIDQEIASAKAGFHSGDLAQHFYDKTEKLARLSVREQKAAMKKAVQKLADVWMAMAPDKDPKQIEKEAARILGDEVEKRTAQLAAEKVERKAALDRLHLGEDYRAAVAFVRDLENPELSAAELQTRHGDTNTLLCRIRMIGHRAQDIPPHKQSFAYKLGIQLLGTTPGRLEQLIKKRGLLSGTRRDTWVANLHKASDVGISVLSVEWPARRRIKAALGEDANALLALSGAEAARERRKAGVAKIVAKIKETDLVRNSRLIKAAKYSASVYRAYREFRRDADKRLKFWQHRQQRAQVSLKEAQEAAARGALTSSHIFAVFTELDLHGQETTARLGRNLLGPTRAESIVIGASQADVKVADIRALVEELKTGCPNSFAGLEQKLAGQKHVPEFSKLLDEMAAVPPELSPKAQDYRAAEKAIVRQWRKSEVQRVFGPTMEGVRYQMECARCAPGLTFKQARREWLRAVYGARQMRGVWRKRWSTPVKPVPAVPAGQPPAALHQG